MGCVNNGSVFVEYGKSKYGELDIDHMVREAFKEERLLKLTDGEGLRPIAGTVTGVAWSGPRRGGDMELRFVNFYSYDVAEILRTLQAKLDGKRKKVWLDGKVSYDDETCGEEGFVDVTKGVVSEHYRSEEDLFYATDAELAKILRSRGYVVTKKKKGKGRK